jgi:competence protein ComGC
MRKESGRSFIGIIVFIAIISLLLRFGIEKLIKMTVRQNEISAQAALKLIATAIDNYTKDHEGSLPASLVQLVRNNPAYLDKDYVSDSPVRGYDYNCVFLRSQGYSCTAVPVRCGFTGNVNFSITTGGLFVSEECKKKE